MRVLCFYDDETPGSHLAYVNHMMAVYPETTFESGNHRDLVRLLTSSLFDIVLLFCNDRSLLQVTRTRKLAAAIRTHQPTCLIMLHRDFPGPLTRWFASVPKTLYDFSFDDYLDPLFLPRFARTLWYRHQNQLAKAEPPRHLKGIITTNELLGKVLGASISKSGTEVCVTDVTENFEKEFRHQLPDFAVLHCHNRKGDFEIVRNATHFIRRVHPACIIFITCSFTVKDHYGRLYEFDQYTYDAILTIPLSYRELLAQLNRNLGLRYHLPPAHP